MGIILVNADKQVFHASPFLDRQALMQEIRTAEKPENRLPHHADKFLPLGYRSLNVLSKFTVLEKPLNDGRIGSLYLVFEAGTSKQVNEAYARRFFTIVLMGMAGLILLLTFLVTNSLMQSLRKLKDGVRHIAEGDLNFSIKTNKKDEVAQVVMAFEEMRLRLKSSIDAQLKEDESRKELVSSISHDLKTPVTAIKGYVEGLIDGVADTPEKEAEYLSTILSKTIALDRMIDDLFLYSSLDIGRAAYHMEVVPAAELLENLCSETNLDLSEKGFEVNCRLDIPSDVKLRVDRQMIRRLQHNLTENAAKYCKPEGRRVSFTVCVKDSALVCSTEDNGIGIQASEMPYIFDRFYRADAARTSTIGGTGLGLQISRRIIEDHGGLIRAESEYGKFTRITWTLPVFTEEGGDGRA